MNTYRIVALMMLLASLTLFTGTSATEEDFTLKVFGNANMDEAVDEEDIEYVLGIIGGTNEATELADANYDGVIDEMDTAQIELIMRGGEKELTIIDSANRIVTVKKPIERMVCILLHPVETMRALGVPVEETIIGQGLTDSVFYPELSNVQNVGWPSPNIEEILALHPDVVILHTFFDQLDQVQEVCEKAGITVLRFNLNYPNSYNDEAKTFSYLFGKSTEAEDLIDFRESVLNSIQATVEKIPEDDRPKVYYEDRRVSYASLNSEYANIESAGGIDIFNGASGSVNPEDVVARNPDIIVKVVTYTEAGGYQLNADDTAGLEAIRAEIMSRPELQNVNAVKTGKVYVISSEICGFYSNSCRGFLQIAYNAKWFHPELFEDLDPNAIHQEYLTRFQGLDIDLDENGVFVYPLEKTT
ncbi:MAG: Periplasmic binding protein [Methanosaeta sp. PtaU1.Bin055]|nr:MAG: Periplasmic binding protein [Methanosaeta sp. PtaU1.Bin055]